MRTSKSNKAIFSQAFQSDVIYFENMKYYKPYKGSNCSFTHTSISNVVKYQPNLTRI